MTRKIALALIVAIFTMSTAHAAMAFLKREYVSGMNRICIYDHLGSEVAITVPVYEICPVTIDF